VAVSAAAVLAIVAGPLRAQEERPQDPAGVTDADAVAEKSANDEDASRSGYWEIGGFIGLLNDEPEYHPDDFSDQFKRSALIGARGGYTLPFGLFMQAQGSNSVVRVAMPRPNGGGADSQNVNTFFVESVFGYNITLSSAFDAFFSGGAGVAICDPDRLPSETDFALNYGVGGRYYFAASRLAVRGDIRMHQVLNAMAETRELVRAAPVGSDLFALELSLAISVFLGR
jgi:hypothetical protein